MLELILVVFKKKMFVISLYLVYNSSQTLLIGVKFSFCSLKICLGEVLSLRLNAQKKKNGATTLPLPHVSIEGSVNIRSVYWLDLAALVIWLGVAA